MTNQFQIEASDALLVIIDVQEKLSAAMPQDILEHMLQKVTTLLDAVHVLEIPVIVTEQYPKGLGDTLCVIGDKIQEYDIPKISKISFSCCGEPGFMEMLELNQRNTVILCGQETHVCVLQTALDLLERGYRVFVAGDAVCSRQKINWQFALDEMRQAGCVIEPVESILFKMLERAGTEEFRAISRLVK